MRGMKERGELAAGVEDRDVFERSCGEGQRGGFNSEPGVQCVVIFVSGSVAPRIGLVSNPVNFRVSRD